jgi:XTP/dITP diphosphohydrolase
VREIVIASKNDGKIREVKRILEDMPVGWITWHDLKEWPELVEDGETFLDNALIKASKLSGATGYAALADDSGLEVAALGGAPGVYSARYGGEEGNDALNVHRLLGELVNVPPPQRTARFVCCVVLYFPGGKCIDAAGTCSGTIAPEPRGSAGFGYDPVFIPDGYDRTFAELPPGEKDSLSHRGRALLALRAAVMERAMLEHGQWGF